MEGEEVEVQAPGAGIKGGQELPPPGAQQQKVLPPPAWNSSAALLGRLAERASAHTACPVRPDATRPPRWVPHSPPAGTAAGVLPAPSASLLRREELQQSRLGWGALRQAEGMPRCVMVMGGRLGVGHTWLDRVTGVRAECSQHSEVSGVREVASSLLKNEHLMFSQPQLGPTLPSHTRDPPFLPPLWTLASQTQTPAQSCPTPSHVCPVHTSGPYMPLPTTRGAGQAHGLGATPGTARSW